VLVPIFDAGAGAHLLLTKRAETVEHHKGQISFPGGGEEPGDADLQATALRETYEEIGLPPESIEVWGRLDELETVVSGFAITPFVGGVPAPTVLRTNPNEIAEVITVPLALFLDSRHLRVEQAFREGRMREVLYYDYPPHVIWGVTARIIKTLIGLLLEDRAAEPAGDGAEGPAR
jgi:8-oxo-dGTP pyrophosphatase MutT (NUDIX family)